MSHDRIEALERQLFDYLDAATPGHGSGPDQPLRPGSQLTGPKAWELFQAQVTSRCLDYTARELRAKDLGFYTIGSAGHEGNAALGDVLEVNDPCFLHYRSGGFMVRRAAKAGRDLTYEALLGVCAAADDPASGGRHKVWGSRELWVPPQTSTIASHLPKAVGAALAIDRGSRLKQDVPVPGDAIAVCSFGDASLNHSTAQGAFNSASWLAHQAIPLPLLFVCEDNGWGISVASPPRWVESALWSRRELRYFGGDGTDLPSAWDTARDAVDFVRQTRRPAFLHLKVVRLLGHAGSDIEREYRDLNEVEASERLDPLLTSARLLVEAGVKRPGEIAAKYRELREQVRDQAARASARPRLSTLGEVEAPLARYSVEGVTAEAERAPPQDAGHKAKRAVGRQRHMAAMINRGLHEALAKYPEALVFGEDVAKKGGVYHVTAGLWQAYGPGRVFNTLLDEQAILGLAIGAAHLGFLPVPEIQYLAYVHNAIDQLRGEACSLSFFSNGSFTNPMVVRIASFAYQRGFGGHFHNDNAIAALREIPSLVIAAPSRGDEAVRMLRTCLALAKVDGRVVAFLEPIALYMTKDLHQPGDGGWLCDFPAAGESIPLGQAGVHREQGQDLTIVSYANGCYRSLRAAEILAREHGIEARVVDLRWLAPLDLETVTAQAAATGRLLVVDECRRAGGPGEPLLAAVAERCPEVRCRLLAGGDTYIPLGPAMEAVLPREETIVAEAKALFENSQLSQA